MNLKNKFVSFMLCLLPTAVLSQPVDIFLVIGQSNARGRAPQGQTSILPKNGEAFEYDEAQPNSSNRFAALTHPTGKPAPACYGYAPDPQECYWTSKEIGPMPAFAATWKAKTGRNAVYVIRPRGGSALTAQGDRGSGYWHNALSTARTPIYLNAINSFNKAYGDTKTRWSIGNAYVIWIQGESDAMAGVTSDAYASALVSLYAQLQDDFSQAHGTNFRGMFIAETGYFYDSTEPLQTHRNKVHQIVAGQQESQNIGGTVLVSKSPRYFMSPCINGISAVGCGSFDGIHYKIAEYEALGIEMANYASIYATWGIKPLSSFPSCSNSYYAPVCGPTVDVYRWNNGSDHATSVSPTEFDNVSGYGFKGVRFHLFATPASGRVPLYRHYNPATGDRMESLGTSEKPGYSYEIQLGYCYSNASQNARVALYRLSNGVNYVTTKDPAEKQAFQGSGYALDPADKGGVLCYTN